MIFTREDGERIAKKLQANIESGRKHDLVIVRFNGLRVGQFGLRRGSKELSHPYIPRQVHLSPRETRDLCDCPLSAQRYFEILLGKGLLSDSPPEP